MEEIAQRLGSEYANAKYLSIAEVSLILKHFKEQGETNEQFNKMHSYVTRYNRFPDTQIAKHVRKMLEEHEFDNRKSLEELQIVLLMNLCPESPDEARVLIPHLESYSDDELRTILDEMARLKNMQ